MPQVQQLMSNPEVSPPAYFSFSLSSTLLPSPSVLSFLIQYRLLQAMQSMMQSFGGEGGPMGVGAMANNPEMMSQMSAAAQQLQSNPQVSLSCPSSLAFEPAHEAPFLLVSGLMWML